VVIVERRDPCLDEGSSVAERATRQGQFGAADLAISAYLA